MPAPEQLFAATLRSDPSRPFVTYYDEDTGERSELSVRSLANWVAKTHHLLSDELGLGVGDTALIAVPAHWISVPVVLGCLTAGLELVTRGGADVAFVAPNTANAAAGIEDVYAIAPASAAVGLREAVLDGTQDYVLAVRPQADAWGTVRFGATESDPGIDGRTRAHVVDAATARAAELGLGAGARVMSGETNWLDDLIAVLVVNGSLVYVTGTVDTAVLDRRAEQERVTNRT